MKTLQEFVQQHYPAINVQGLDRLKNKTILITGASGLIGSNLLAYLDFLNKTRKLNLKIIAIHRSMLEKWMPHSEKITYMQQDLARQDLSKDLKFHFLIHCATYAQPKKFLDHPRETVILNIDLLFDLLEQAEKNQASVLYLSSAEIYGHADKTHTLTNEAYFGNVNTLTERAIYAESKRLAESICYHFSKKVRIRIARVLIAYGPGVKYDDKRVISEFIKQAQKEKEITMMDEGKAQRTFCFITDMVEILLNIMLNGRETVYNVCGMGTTTIKNLAKLISQITEAKFNYKFEEKAIGGTPSIITLDNHRYLFEFKKKNFVPLNKGLMITSEWFESLRQ